MGRRNARIGDPKQRAADRETMWHPEALREDATDRVGQEAGKSFNNAEGQRSARSSLGELGSEQRMGAVSHGELARTSIVGMMSGSCV